MPMTAFVLGGGGVLGATQVGMLQALLAQGITPDLVVGTSIGSVNGAFVAADPSVDGVARLEELWRDVVRSGEMGENPVRQAARFAKYRTHVMRRGLIPDLVARHLGIDLIEDLPVPFQCVAAEIESSASRWFTAGEIGPAVAASCAVPGLFAPVEIDGAHYYDGGLVHSIPVGRAIALGATDIHVLQVGRVEQPLSAPTNPLDVGLVAFEIARRHRFVEEIAEVPDSVRLHVLPSGIDKTPTAVLRGQATVAKVEDRMARAFDATSAYLEGTTR
ncbi:patatin [Janibacter sp. Soil728]|uniref:patatin-like phospholipase family protein n=1 Tax=Janibacter sp. Soil728 TaxID=1736393 RepID=UPI0006F7A8A2|nr:patatin-like phospholipase family protein [Janibacter sp. Soil728]KRE38993.1 patatin [Janibacter sp. Soil728]